MRSSVTKCNISKDKWHNLEVSIFGTSIHAGKNKSGVRVAYEKSDSGVRMKEEWSESEGRVK